MISKIATIFTFIGYVYILGEKGLKRLIQKNVEPEQIHGVELLSQIVNIV